MGRRPVCDPHLAMILQDVLFRAEPGRIKGLVQTGPLLRRAEGADVEVTVLCKPLYDEFATHRFSVCVLSTPEDQHRQYAGDFLSSIPNMIFI